MINTKPPPGMIANPAVMRECQRRDWPANDADAFRAAAGLIGEPVHVPATADARRDLGRALGVRDKLLPVATAAPARSPIPSLPAASANSTSSTAPRPEPQQTTGAKSCLEMNDAELRAFEREHGIRR